jgi:hypothetical protein
MTETVQATPAEKRKWLKENGYPVATRGKLSAEHEQAYSTGTPASAEVQAEA